MKKAILIPAYEPGYQLIELVKELIKTSIAVVVVDDGSGKCYEDIFNEIIEEGVHVIKYDNNEGKGRALKTGLLYLLENGFEGVITADSDGQHSVMDIIKISNELDSFPNKLIIGVRNTTKMPFKSRFGNDLTRLLFKVMYGVDVTDTQTGLRGMSLSADLLSVSGERYEYEMNVLIQANQLWGGGF